MSKPSSNFFDLTHNLPRNAREHSASDPGEGHLRYALKKARGAAQLRTVNGAASLAAAIVALGLIALAPGSELLAPAHAQAIPKSLAQGGPDSALRQRKNAWTVGVAGGQLSGTYMTFADELAQVLDDGDNLRVIPIVTYGAASNLDDLLYLRQIDIVMTQADVFEYFRTERKTPNLEHRIHYLIRLPVSELHVLARTEIRNIQDLRGKKVSFGPAGAASSLTGPIVFQRLGVQVEQVHIDNATALQRLVGRDRSAGAGDRQADQLLPTHPRECGASLASYSLFQGL